VVSVSPELDTKTSKKKGRLLLRFEVLTVVLMKIHVFWDVPPVVNSCQHLKEAEAWIFREEYS
jgi:hypothetical protein